MPFDTDIEFDKDGCAVRLPDIWYVHNGPCLPLIRFRWAGFKTDTDALGFNGWLTKCLYSPFKKKYLLKFVHFEHRMTFAVEFSSIDELNGKEFELAFMSVGGIGNRRPKQNHIHELNVKDIPVLLEIVVALQRTARKKMIKQMILPQAEILFLKKMGNNE